MRLGSAPALGGDGCPADFGTATIYALGCSGWLAIEIVRNTGTVIPLDPTAGLVIRVYEWGQNCTGTPSEDEYAVFVCTDDAAVRGGDDGACSILLGASFGGEMTFPVTFWRRASFSWSRL